MLQEAAEPASSEADLAPEVSFQAKQQQLFQLQTQLLESPKSSKAKRRELKQQINLLDEDVALHAVRERQKSIEGIPAPERQPRKREKRKKDKKDKSKRMDLDELTRKAAADAAADVTRKAAFLEELNSEYCGSTRKHFLQKKLAKIHIREVKEAAWHCAIDLAAEKIKEGLAASALDKAWEQAVAVTPLSEISSEDLQLLLQDPSLAAQFDAKYVAEKAAAEYAAARAAAEAALLLAWNQAPVSNARGGVSGEKRISPEHVSMLVEEPSLATKFDELYGVGASVANLKLHPKRPSILNNAKPFVVTNGPLVPSTEVRTITCIAVVAQPALVVADV